MIRKSLICIAGVLAGASTGAYNDGFFEQENVVTNTYQQIVSKFDPSANSSDSADSAIAEPNDLNSDADAAITAVSTDAKNSSISKLSDASPEASTVKTVKDAQTDNKESTDSNENQKSVDTAKELDLATETEESDPKNLAQEETGTPKKNVSASDADKLEKVARDTTEEDLAVETKDVDVDVAKPLEDENLEKDQQSLEQAKSLALLDVRFSKEIFKSTSGGELKYRKLSPRTAGNDQPLPLIVFLHGLGECGDDNLSQLKHGLSFLASREGMQEFPATIIAPQCPKGERWTTTLVKRPGLGKLDPTPSVTMRLTMELIDSIQLTDNIDPNRIYVTGLSMGGFGTFDLIARRPNLAAAAVPLCGGGDVSSGVINRIKDIPLWIIHGDKDPVVDVNYSREMVKALKDAGASPRYSELAGFKHDIWDAAYADTELYKWMFNQSETGPINAAKNSTSTSNLTTSKVAGNDTTKGGTQQSANQSGTNEATLKAAIQGEWNVLAATQRGRRADPATLAKMRVAFNDDALIIRIGDRNETANFRLPVSKNSTYPWIDIVSQREGVKDSAGIMAKQGDKLVLCWAMPGQPRPTTFDSKEGIKTLVLEEK